MGYRLIFKVKFFSRRKFFFFEGIRKCKICFFVGGLWIFPINMGSLCILSKVNRFFFIFLSILRWKFLSYLFVFLRLKRNVNVPLSWPINFFSLSIKEKQRRRRQNKKIENHFHLFFYKNFSGNPNEEGPHTRKAKRRRIHITNVWMKI